MFDLYKNIEFLCKKHGTSPTKVCEDAGLSRSTLSNLKNGRAKTLSVRNAAKIAEVLGESYDTVMHGLEKENAQPEMSEVDRALFNYISKMTDEDKLLALDMISAIMARRKND